MKHYRYTDDGGDSLIVTSVSGGSHAVLSAAEVFVDPLCIPEIAAAMYRACGQVPPVMLARPELPDGPWRSHPGSQLAVSAHGRMVRLEYDQPGGHRVSLSPGQARSLAAVIAARADAADMEPDPAEVGDLARVIHAAACPGCADAPPGEDLAAARTALRWMRDREVRND
jgi:hypothetical protein